MESTDRGGTYKQHMVRIPSKMSLRFACGALEKVDHI